MIGVAVASGCLNLSVTSFFGEDVVPDAKFLDNGFIAREFRNLRRQLKLDDVGCAANAESIIDENLDAESVFKHACSIRGLGKNPVDEFTNSPKKYEFRSCLDEACLNPQGQVYFDQLDELNRNMLQGFIEDEAFMNRYCQPKSAGTNNPYLSSPRPSSQTVEQPRSVNPGTDSAPSTPRAYPRYQMGTTPLNKTGSTNESQGVD